MAMECEMKSGAGEEVVASEVFTTPKGARPRTQCLETPPSRSPHRAQRGSNRQDRSSSKRQGKVAEALQVAVACRDVVKGPTGVCCGVSDKAGLVHSVVEHCKALGLWQACTVVGTEGKVEEGSLSVAASCVGSLVQEVVEGRIQNGLAVMGSSDGLDSAGVAKAVCSALGHSQAMDRVLLVDCNGCPGSWLPHTLQDEPQVLVMSLQWQHHNNSGITAAGHTEAHRNVLSCVVPPEAGYCCTLVHQVLLPVAYEFMPRMVVMMARQEWISHAHPALLSQVAALFMPVARGCLVVAVEADHQGAKAAGAAVLSTLLHGIPAPTVPGVSKSPSPEVCQSVLGLIKIHQTQWNSLRHHALSSLVASLSERQGTPLPSLPSKLTSTQETVSTPLPTGSVYYHFILLC